MEELFKKIYIKPEKGLPKKKGSYFCYPLKGIKLIPKNRTYNALDRANVVFWVDCIDWYLLPVEQPTDEEIDLKAKNNWINENNISAFIDGAKWMRDKL
jgi:hypothetical protein